MSCSSLPLAPSRPERGLNRRRPSCTSWETSLSYVRASKASPRFLSTSRSGRASARSGKAPVSHSRGTS
eukprot:scaffold2195_cov430-Prasinococcus_capsulatus_cf.AAC.8